MPFQPIAVARPQAPGDHLDLSAQDAAYRPATVKQKMQQWYGEGGGVVETTTPEKGKMWTAPKSPMKAPAIMSTSPPKKETAMLHKEPRGPLLPDNYEAKPLDIIRDTKTGAHALVKARAPPKAARAAVKPGPTTWDPQRKVFVRKRETKPQNHEDDEMKLATSPKKRLVSDGHWRKDRSPVKQEESPRYVDITDQKPQRIITQKSTPDFRTKPAKPAATTAFAVRKAPERPKWMPLDPTRQSEPAATMARKRSKSPPPERRADTSSVNVERAVPRKVTATRTPQKSPRNRTDRHSFESESTEQTPIAKRSPPMRRQSRQQPHCSPPVSEPDTEIPFSLASPGPDDSISRVGLPRSAPKRLSRSQEQPRKISKNEQRKPSGPAPMFQGKTAAEPGGPAPVFGKRIEAWLGGQAEDPFWDETSTVTDDRTSSMPSPIPEPLRPRKREDKRPSPDTRQPLKSSGQNRQFSYEQNGSPRSTGFKTSPSNKENTTGQRQASYEVGDEQTFNKRASTGRDGIGLGINMRREFPTTGKALSTIAASEVTQEPYRNHNPEASLASESYAASSISLTTIGGGPAEPTRKKSPSLKRKLTKHDDLMTVLSVATSGPSLVSARSFRTQKLRLDRQNKEEVLQELATEEAKYQRELQTLVDGVIPVLLSNVLSKSGSRSPSTSLGKEGKKQNATQPIVDMGVALERLKTQHKRMPPNNPGALLVWAQNASRIYEDYIKAWKMGFDDVVINVPKGDKASWHEGLVRNAAGDLVNANGDRVDVAYLLKRPLVRVKNLTKTFRAINYLLPSPDAEAMSERYHALMVAARKKSNDELARIEDEAASSIDPTRARDPKSLAPLAGVRIDPSRSVRARDYFEMNLKHSSGQQLDCAIEVIIRDNEANPDNGGDVLFCEISDTGRWLLFPPVIQEMVSTRRGKGDLELIMMVRGVGSDGNDWSELLTLHSSSEDAIDEWANMLCDGPVPPSPTQTEFTLPVTTPLTPDIDLIPSPLSPTPPPPSPGRTEKSKVTFKSRTPSPSEVDIPIGEQARKTSKRWSFGVGMAAELLDQATPRVFKKTSGSYPPVSMDNRKSSRSAPNSPAERSGRVDKPGDPYAYTDKAAARNLPDSRPTLKRSTTVKSRGGTPTRSRPGSPTSEYSDSTIRDRSPTRSPQPRRPSFGRSKPTLDSMISSRSSQSEYSVWMPSTSSQLSDEDSVSDDDEDDRRTQSQPVTRAQTAPLSPRPAIHSRTASTPSMDLPVISKIRPTTPQRKPVPSREGSNLSSDTSSELQTPRPGPTRSEPSHLSSDMSREAPSSAPGKLQKFVAGLKSDKKPEPKPASQTPTRPKSGLFSTPKFLQNRRPSSPLKREYDPAADNAISDSDSEDDYSDEDSLSSYSSDEEDEKYDHFSQVRSPEPSPAPQFPKATPPQSLASMSGPSLGPSNSASQGPYRTVPQQASQKADKTVANIFSWSDRGSWDPLHPVEVTVVVSAGLIEAFSMSEAHGVPTTSSDGSDVSPSHFGVTPLVALELTPLVPLRRGTALDISIRSPPTANSKIRSSNNVMFRSRSPEECERLYALINQARINNATYIALQNARPYNNEGTWAAQMDKRNAMRSSSGNSWFGGLGSRRGSTYRSNSIRKRHSSAMSDSSVGTMNTAFSALRRLSGTWRKPGAENSTNSDSLESGQSTPNRNSMMMSGGLGPGALGGELALGVKEMKVRLYHRESASKWRDMGSARLTIMLPERPDSAGGSPSRGGEATPPGPRGAPGMSKRILVKGTTKGETLLDATLGEGSFERVARTGIAVSVWRDNEGSSEQAGRALDRGGVGASWMDVFMVQMKSERDAAFTFGLVGKLRY